MINRKIVITTLLLSLILTSGFGCSNAAPADAKYMRETTLNYWRVWDGPDAFQEIINAYQAAHPFVKINYKKLRYEEYEKELIEAFATDRGPDIFSVQNTWTRKYQAQGLVEPMPASVKMSYPYQEGKIKKQIMPNVKTVAGMSLKRLKDDFVDAIYDDVVIRTRNNTTNAIEERIYGVPLALDTLAVYYNKDLFNNAGIANPPSFWNRDLQQNVKKLTKQDSKGEIVQSGAGLGGGDNIARASDILSALMMQNGTEMMRGELVTFNQKPQSFARDIVPGLDALRFYTDFANPAKEVYCWNNGLANSLDLFIQGKLAMMFGYSYMLPQIKAMAPKLNFGISRFPQIEDNPPVNFANYWVEVVSAKIQTDYNNLAKGKDYAKQKSDTAWHFIQFAAKAEQVKSYLDKTKKVTALRKLVDGQTEDVDIGEFAKQALTAKSWYKGQDAVAAETIFIDMIEAVAAGRETTESTISLGSRKVQQTINVRGKN